MTLTSSPTRCVRLARPCVERDPAAVAPAPTSATAAHIFDVREVREDDLREDAHWALDA